MTLNIAPISKDDWKWFIDHKQSHYLYRYYDAEGLLVYIGCTAYSRRRQTLHGNQPAQSSKLIRAVDARCEVDATPYVGRIAARAAEAAAIREEQPLFNVQHRRIPTWLIACQVQDYLAAHGLDPEGLLPANLIRLYNEIEAAS